MEALKELARRIRRLKMATAMRSILKDRDLQDFIVELNTEGQLFEGIDSTGESLQEIGGEYRERTKSRKRRKGQPTERVTLLDTGDFYASFMVDAGQDGFEIVADTLKEDEDLQDRWGRELLGLTDYNENLLAVKIIPLLRLYILEKILR